MIVYFTIAMNIQIIFSVNVHIINFEFVFINLFIILDWLL